MRDRNRAMLPSLVPAFTSVPSRRTDDRFMGGGWGVQGHRSRAVVLGVVNFHFYRSFCDHIQNTLRENRKVTLFRFGDGFRIGTAVEDARPFVM